MDGSPGSRPDLQGSSTKKIQNSREFSRDQEPLHPNIGSQGGLKAGIFVSPGCRPCARIVFQSFIRALSTSQDKDSPCGVLEDPVPNSWRAKISSNEILWGIPPACGPPLVVTLFFTGNFFPSHISWSYYLLSLTFGGVFLFIIISDKNKKNYNSKREDLKEEDQQ